MKKRKLLGTVVVFELFSLLVLGGSPSNAQEAPQGQIEKADPKDERLKKLAEEKERKQAELMRRKEEKFRKLTEANTSQGLEVKARRRKIADSELKRQQELQDKAGQKEEGLKAKREELERKKEEEQRLIAEKESERQQKLKARQEELERKEEERQDRVFRLQIERHRKLKDQQEELAREKEERGSRLAGLKAKKAEETRRRELELSQKKEEEQRRAAEAEARKQEELARQKEESLGQLRELKDKLEEEVAAKKKELAGKRQEKLKRAAELKIKQDMEVKAGREELERQQESRARQEELAREKEERERRLAELKAKKGDKTRAGQIELSHKREEVRKGITGIEERQQEEAARHEEEKRKKLERLKAEQYQELKASQKELSAEKQEEVLRKEQKLTQQEIEKQKLALGKEAKVRQELKAKQQELLRQKEGLDQKIAEMKKSVVQEKVVTEVMLKKHKEDEAKVIKIDKLWMKARKLYSQGMYEEAIKDFEQIIKLEGNPRIKYTPQAKEFIEKAKEQIEGIKTDNLSRDVKSIEGDMMNEVLKRQIPPYVEPPVKQEKLDQAPLIEPPAIRKKIREKKITMDFDKVDLKSVILFLSQESGINFVASSRVQELGLKVTTRFNDTSLDEVVKYIIKSLGLVYRIDKEVVWIAHPEEIAQEASETRVYYLTKGGGLFSEFSSVSGGTDTALGGSSSQISKIATIEDTLKEVVPWPQDAKLTFDKRINALIVRNTPQNLQTLEDMLYSLDVAPIQILIEARFLEVNVTDTEELGLEWKVANSDFPLKKATEPGGTKGFSHGVAKDSGVDFSAFSRAAEGFNLTYKGLLTTPQFEAVLHALEESKKTKTLSSPRITTLNNQMATIKVVDEWLYPTRYEYEVVQTDINGDGDFDDAGETTYKNVPKDFLRRDVGILLKVIPSAGADKKTISLSLIPEVSEAVADGFTYTGDVKLPKFTSRNLSTSVVVNSGETVVLGGLIKESRTKTLTKVPFLGDIPFIGGAFRKNADSIERKNLLIFVTARIISPSGEEVVVAQK